MGEEVAGGGPEDPIADVLAVVTIAVGGIVAAVSPTPSPAPVAGGGGNDKKPPQPPVATGGCPPDNPRKFGGSKSPQKWANQMQNRGWTFQQIEDAIQNGESFPAPNNINPGNGATRYVSPQTGQSVVIDNTTGEVLHVGGPGFAY